MKGIQLPKKSSSSKDEHLHDDGIVTKSGSKHDKSSDKKHKRPDNRRGTRRHQAHR